jgi:nitrogen regulatory protein PII-like uncharacterized protein
MEKSRLFDAVINQGLQTTNYFDYPKIDLTHFPYSKINNVKQCKKSLEYIVIQIENIGRVINWMASEYSITFKVFHESDVNSPGFMEGKKDIEICYERINKVKPIINEFLTSGVIVINNQRKIIEHDVCNALRDAVNNQTERIELIINQYKEKEIKYKVFLFFLSLNDSIKIYYEAITCFNETFDRYRERYNI